MKISYSLNGEESDIGDAMELPEYVQIEADVTDFALPMTLMPASSEVFVALPEAMRENGIARQAWEQVPA